MLSSWLRRGGTRGTAALAAAVTLASGGATALVWGVSHQRHAPQPSPAAHGTLAPVVAARSIPAAPPPRGHAAAIRSPVVGPTLAKSTPTAIAIPAIGVSSALLEVGRSPNGSVAVPQPGPHYNDAAWYDGLRTPGELGPAVIEGHVDSAADGPSVFFRLGALHVGNRVYVTRADRRVAVFAVNAVRSYPKTAFPNNLVYGATDHAALRLITCGGQFDRATGGYLSNIVVFAHLTGAQPRTAPRPVT